MLAVYRYNALAEPCQIRRDNLEDAHLLYQFSRDVNDELSWIHEKKPVAMSTDLGTSLTAVQNLQKKHQVHRKTLRMPFVFRGTRMIDYCQIGNSVKLPE